MLAYLQDDEGVFVYTSLLLVSFYIYWPVKNDSRFWAAFLDTLAYFQDDECVYVYTSLLLVSFYIYWPVKRDSRF